MALPWVRLDSNIASHDKILPLLDEKPEALAYRAAFCYVCALGYAGGHGTGGLVPFSALAFIHGSRKAAELLVRHHLWQPDPLGWTIRNFDLRQQSAATTKSIRNSQRAGAIKANCHRWHGPACGCWKETA